MATRLIRFAFLVTLLETASSRALPLNFPGDKTTSSKSIYDAFRAHGLPMGLLPKGVRRFTVDEEGRFEAFLEEACDAKFESRLHYDRNVSGRLSYGQIGELTGVAAQELFLWFPVKAIRVDVPSSGLIYFDVGVVFKQFSLSLFESPPDCLPLTLPMVILILFYLNYYKVCVYFICLCFVFEGERRDEIQI